jgi:hypothetical protein
VVNNAQTLDLKNRVDNLQDMISKLIFVVL